MDDFGVRSKKLKALAKTPQIPVPEITLDAEGEATVYKTWWGATLKEVSGNELSAFGVGFDKAGIAIEAVPAESQAASVGLRNGDLLQAINGTRITDFQAFEKFTSQGEEITSLDVIREQKQITLNVAPKADK